MPYRVLTRHEHGPPPCKYLFMRAGAAKLTAQGMGSAGGDQATRYVERLKAVAAVGAAIASVSSLDVVLDRIVHETAQVMDVKVTAIVLVDEPRKGVTVAAIHGHDGAGRWVPAESAASWQAILSGRPFEVLDGQTDDRFAHLRDFALVAGTHTTLCVPLMARNRMLGTLDIHNGGIRHFDAQDVQLLEIVAGQAAIALENARLYESLERERRLLATVVEGTEDALILEGGGGEVVWANEVAGQLLSARAESLRGRSVASIYDSLARLAPQPDETIEELSSAVRRHERAPLDLHLLRPDRDLRVRIMHVERGQWFLHVFRDVAAERAADRARNVLLSTVSHELRTPLTNIKGFISTLLLPDANWDAPTQRDFLWEIEGQADHLAELVGNLLDVSRLQAGVLQVNKRWSDLGQIIDRVLAQVGMDAGAGPISVSVAADVPPLLLDGGRIAEVVRNLLDNAAKYAPRESPKEVAASCAGDEVVVSVSDRGPGVPAEVLEALFEPFYRYVPEGQQVPGSGLGLAICKGLVEAHGGRVWAESRPGMGLRVSFSLPVTAAPEPGRAAVGAR
jgi:K+-sensing histidine kinase KdpD